MGDKDMCMIEKPEGMETGFRTKPGLIPAFSKAGNSLYLSIGIYTW